MKYLVHSMTKRTCQVLFIPFCFLVGLILPHVCYGQSGPSGSGPSRLITLNEAVDMALKNHPAIEEQKGKVIYQQGRTGEVIGAYYPKIYMGGDYSRIKPVGNEPSSSVNVNGMPSGSSIPSVSGRSPSYEQYSASANINQRVFDFGQTHAQVRAQKLSAIAARYDLENVRSQVIFYVKQTYYRLLGAQRARDVRQESVEQFKKHLEYAKALYSVGSKPRLDTLKAEVDLSNAKVDLIKAENEVNIQTANLNMATGLPQNTVYAVEESRSADVAGLSLEDALNIAFERRPDFQSAKKQRQSAAEAVSAAKTAHLPTFSGSASYYYAGTSFPLQSGWQAGANVIIPIFTGFVTSYQVTQAQGNYMSMLAREKSLEQNITLDLQQSYLSLREAEERMKSGEIAVQQAREGLNMANEQYRVGTARAVDVADAVAGLAKARLDEISARYDHWVAHAAIEKAIGGR
jgi:outer membrane protein